MIALFLFSFSTEVLRKCQTFVSNLGSCSYTYASKAFLFSLYNKDGYNPVKLTQYQNQQYAMYHCSNYGPTFGAGGYHDIYISDNSMGNSGSHTYCGNTYSVPSGFFTGGQHFSPTDIEVFYAIGD